VDVTGIRFYDTYGQPAFSAGYNAFTVADGSTFTLWIKFSPRHNIFHHSELILENSSMRGYVSVELEGMGKYSLAYYDSSDNKTEEALKTSLRDITGNGYVSLGYNVARDSMFMVIDNKKTNGQGATQNTIECIYTGRQAVGYTDRTDCQTTYSFNTEHTFPQGFFSSLEPMKSDLHHLFPTDDNANNVRASYPFGVVSNPTWTQGGSKYANSIFEPRDAQKGITARAMLYFVIRYQNYSGFLTSQESILRTWNNTFPPLQVERVRNDQIDGMQHNRNPFVDYPQLLERITSISNFSVQPTVASIDLSQTQINYGYVVSSVNHVYHFVVVNDGNVPVHLYNFTLNQPSLFTFGNGTGGGDTLLPGEALKLDVNLLTGNSPAINSMLIFNTNIPGLTTVSVPIHADGASPVGIPELNSSFVAPYPNPVNHLLTFEKAASVSSFVLTNITGRVLHVPVFSPAKEKWVLDLSSLGNGIYFLRCEGSNTIYKVVKD
jgi:deoxyribonuclease-1